MNEPDHPGAADALAQQLCSQLFDAAHELSRVAISVSDPRVIAAVARCAAAVVDRLGSAVDELSRSLDAARPCIDWSYQQPSRGAFDNQDAVSEAVDALRYAATELQDDDLRSRLDDATRRVTRIATPPVEPPF